MPRRSDHQYVWVERAHRGPMGERRWDMVRRVEGRRTAEEIRGALETAGHHVIVRLNNAKYPGT